MAMLAKPPKIDNIPTLSYADDIPQGGFAVYTGTTDKRISQGEGYALAGYKKVTNKFYPIYYRKKRYSVSVKADENKLCIVIPKLKEQGYNAYYLNHDRTVGSKPVWFDKEDLPKILENLIGYYDIF